MNSLTYEIDQDGIATVIIDMPGKVNVMNGDFTNDMNTAVAELADNPDVKGVVLASGKSTFFAGGDVKTMAAAPGEGFNEALTDGISQGRTMIRALERLQVPVAAAVNGAALGGGYELTLACNHRVAWDSPRVMIGLPEANLGLLPGGGGCVRMVKKFGLVKALPYLLNGTVLSAREALDDGLVDELVENAEDLVPAGKAWILANLDNPAAAVQPWDAPGYAVPGGDLNNPVISGFANRQSFKMLEETRGLLPNKIKILDVAVETLKLDIDTALKIEGRGLVSCIISPIGKNLMASNFIQSTQVRRAPGRPADIERQTLKRVAVIGEDDDAKALALGSAAAGLDVITLGQSGLNAGKNAAGSLTEAEDLNQLGDCDAYVLTGGSVDAASFVKLTSDSEIPLICSFAKSGEAGAVSPCLRFVHSAVPEKPAVIELITAETVNPIALACAYDYFRSTGSVVIVSNGDSFLERVEKARREEVKRMVDAGEDATIVRNVAHSAGFDRERLDIGQGIESDPAVAPSSAMPSKEQISIMKDRLLFAPAIEAMRCLEEGVLGTVAEGNVASLHALDAPAWTGGYLQFVNHYGLDAFAVRAKELATQFGEQFAPPDILSQFLEDQRQFA